MNAFESLQEMTERVGCFQFSSVPDEPEFSVAPDVAEKVSAETGSFRPDEFSDQINNLFQEKIDQFTD